MPRERRRNETGLGSGRIAYPTKAESSSPSALSTLALTRKRCLLITPTPLHTPASDRHHHPPLVVSAFRRLAAAPAAAPAVVAAGSMAANRATRSYRWLPTKPRPGGALSPASPDGFLDFVDAVGGLRCAVFCRQTTNRAVYVAPVLSSRPDSFFVTRRRPLESRSVRTHEACVLRVIAPPRLRSWFTARCG
ncbi:unnamed protein product [Rhizoctonia solani]|uniref:Uncharacterized protein n=1 Tax=Rhizoctonia solani TaxID=456999 RepID=A0A8H3CEX5_9AGAM|nr:unnamed protein product [Rhizoctonia solani]